MCLCLAAATFFTFSRLGGSGYDFLTLDDDEYVVDNPHVKTGLSLRNLAWACTAFHSHNWHPLTWLSLQLDAQIYGLWAPGYHRTNILLHVATVVLLFLWLARMTGALWTSAAAAALFGLHPLRVESVAWIAERKDVLSGFFAMLTLWAYAGYAQRPSLGHYLWVALALVLGLLAKPMLVTLPFILLLLDYWPLCRLRAGRAGTRATELHAVPASVGRLLAEKAPLLALASASAMVTVFAQQGVVQSLTSWPLWVRILNASLSYTRYLEKTFWPRGLAIFYPHAGPRISIPLALASSLLLTAITVLVIWQARPRPYLLVGWLWYLGTLVPVIGLVQVGLQAMADRYTYLPFVGLVIMVAWGLRSLPGARQLPATAWLAAATCVLATCAALTWVQAGAWKNGVSVLRRAEEVTPRSATVEHCLGEALVKAGDDAAAAQHFRAAIGIDHNDMFAHYDLGLLLGKAGDLDGAVEQFNEAVRLLPTSADAHNFLGETLGARAHEHAVQAARWEETGKPREADVARAAARQDLETAIEHLRLAVRYEPRSPSAFANLGKALLLQGRYAEAEARFLQSLQIRQDQPEVRNFLRLAREMSNRAAQPQAPTPPR